MPPRTLAQLLIERKQLDKKIGELTKVLVRNLFVEEGEEPVQPIDNLLEEIEGAIGQFAELTVQISTLNNSAGFKVDDRFRILPSSTPDGEGVRTVSLRELIIHRDTLKRLYGVLDSVADSLSSAREGGFSYRQESVKRKRMYAYSDARKRADEYARAFRQLDVVIQGINWQVVEQVQPVKEE